MAIHVFPLELRESRKSWPYVAFSVSGTAGMGDITENGNYAFSEDIFFPIPQSLAFGSSANYSTIDLGVLATAQMGAGAGGLLGGAAGALEDMGAEGALGGAIVGGSIGAMAGGIMSSSAGNNAYAAASLSARMAKQDDVANRIDFSKKKVLAPNTNVKFDSMSIRSFSFNFKMVGRSKSDTTVIDRIAKIFQKYIYPEGDDVILKYPPTWQIKFYDGDGLENLYIPGIYDCYLTSFSSTFNSSTNIFHEDGSPIETDISLSFQETKQLNRQEIMKLNPKAR